jgi:hypothetical protein
MDEGEFDEKPAERRKVGYNVRIFGNAVFAS